MRNSTNTKFINFSYQILSVQRDVQSKKGCRANCFLISLEHLFSQNISGSVSDPFLMDKTHAIRKGLLTLNLLYGFINTVSAVCLAS